MEEKCWTVVFSFKINDTAKAESKSLMMGLLSLPLKECLLFLGGLQA